MYLPTNCTSWDDILVCLGQFSLKESFFFLNEVYKISIFKPAGLIGFIGIS